MIQQKTGVVLLCFLYYKTWLYAISYYHFHRQMHLQALQLHQLGLILAPAFKFTRENEPQKEQKRTK